MPTFRKGAFEMKLRNKLVAAWVFLFIASVSIGAQSPPELEVSDARFTYNVNAALDPANVLSGKRAGAPTTVTDSPVQRVSALFRNAGSKPIKSVSWEYIVFKDSDEREILEVYSVRSNRTILPGESARLHKEGYRLRNSSYQKARVTRIEYADGTVWQGSKTKR
jgi:hypothetical protein